jgi:peptidoglycan biosynthesis protein MviN/MurJ (putative lipid II flippase)
MGYLKKLSRYGSGPAALLLISLATGAIFKLSAFAREAFIAAKFGLSSVTDAYFGLQQFPLALASFMFGAFSLAFTPAYENEHRRRSGNVEWLPGLLFYSCVLGAVLTAVTVVCAPCLLRLIHSTDTREVRSTVVLLGACYLPIIWIGIWKGICTARGRNLWATSLPGLPYLIMTLVLVGSYAIGRLSNLSLPVSMTAGFALVGLYALVRIGRSQHLLRGGSPVIAVWKVPECRRFLRQLAASAVENAGFIANQSLLLYFLARLGTGVISANNCAMRIGMLGYSLFSMPLTSLVQGRLCSAEDQERPTVFRRWLMVHAALQLLFAVAVCAFRFPLLGMVYMHGKFGGKELAEVAHILPAWVGYCVVMSLSELSANYLFIRAMGVHYMRIRLCAYLAANLLRVALIGTAGAANLIWCSVIIEAFVLALNLRTCLTESKFRLPASTAIAAATAS